MKGKIIGGDAENVMIGYENGQCETVPRVSLPEGMVLNNGDGIEVFTDPNGAKVITKTATFVGSPGQRPVNKIAYCLFAFFLGGFGAHKFYVGKVMMGIIYLLFCWTGIPALVALVEAIMAIAKQTDEAGNIYL